jgi:hypothetical protein
LSLFYGVDVIHTAIYPFLSLLIIKDGLEHQFIKDDLENQIIKDDLENHIITDDLESQISAWN